MKFRLLLIALSLASIPTFAETSSVSMTDSQKLDTLMAGQKTLIEAVADEPLAGKNFGIEIAPIRLLTLGIGNSSSASGTISLFNISRSAEIAIPLLYSHFTKSGDEYNAPNNFTLITADLCYRQFLGHHQNGFYLSGFGRLANLNGYKSAYPGNSIFDYNAKSADNKRLSETKFGVGVGMGYRIFSHRGLYYGVSLSMGRYLNGGNDEFRGSDNLVNDDSQFILDVEFLKIGWAF